MSVVKRLCKLCFVSLPEGVRCMLVFQELIKSQFLHFFNVFVSKLKDLIDDDAFLNFVKVLVDPRIRFVVSSNILN